MLLVVDKFIDTQGEDAVTDYVKEDADWDKDTMRSLLGCVKDEVFDWDEDAEIDCE